MSCDCLWTSEQTTRAFLLDWPLHPHRLPQSVIMFVNHYEPFDSGTTVTSVWTLGELFSLLPAEVFMFQSTVDQC